MSLGNDLTEPVAAAGLLAGVLAVRRDRAVLAGLLFGYAALTRETAIIVPAALGLTRLAAPVGRLARPPGAPISASPVKSARPARSDLAWGLPLTLFAAWQLTLWTGTGHLVLLTSADRNSGPGLPFSALAGALRMNLGLLWPPTGAAYIWLLELATLAAVVIAALTAARAGRSPGYERVALLLFTLELGVLAPDIWSGHADLRSVDEVYLFAVLTLLGSRRRLGGLACCVAVTALVAAAHQALHLS